MPTFKREIDLEQELYKLLIDSGFPKEAIVRQMILRSPSQQIIYRPDITIIDTNTKNVVAIIEIKGIVKHDFNQYANQYANQVALYVNYFKDITVKGFLALENTAQGGFNFYALGENDKLYECPREHVLSYENLLLAQATGTYANLATKHEQTIDIFKILCLSFSAISFLLIITDYFTEIDPDKIFTTERLALYCIGLGLAFIPYVQRLKILGIEIERYTNDDKK